MSTSRLHHATHEITVAAAPEVVFGMLADVERWPQLFRPTVHATVLERTGDTERLRLWATANDEIRTWTSVRSLDLGRRRIAFRQDPAVPPVAAMSGEWRVDPLPDGRSAVVLTHAYAAVDDDPEVVDWLSRAVEANSTSELAALRDRCAPGPGRAGLTTAFSDSLDVSADGADVYRFLYEAQEWPLRLPHVARIDLHEDVPGLQLMAMDTRAPDGAVHTTRSVRVCFPTERIVYKQIEPPALLDAHTGCWELRPHGDGVRVVSHHTVVIDPGAVTGVLGPDATAADARAAVREALGTNSRVTLQRAKAFAEARRG